MGRRGAQVLLERIADREKEFPAEIVMMPELVVRESTGAGAKRIKVVARSGSLSSIDGFAFAIST